MGKQRESPQQPRPGLEAEMRRVQNRGTRNTRMAYHKTSRSRNRSGTDRQGRQSNKSSAHRAALHASIKTLVVDIGGTGIKAMVVNEIGEPAGERVRLPTPKRKTPSSVLKTISRLAKYAGRFHRVSVGFPGTIRNGVVLGAANLAPAWKHFNLINALAKILRKKPIRTANDADMQGYGAIFRPGSRTGPDLGHRRGIVVIRGWATRP